VTGETVEMTQKFRAQRPDGVIDLGGVMDGVESPIYFDTGHTNEAGAKIVADAVLQRLLPTLRSLDGGP
jgi:lysophospholipase L1-like esterase